jgi:hypothetical protein
VVRYRDASLVERLLAASAKEAGMPVEQLRTALIGRANTQAKDLAQPEATQALRQLALFLKNPQDATVTIAPPRPLALAQIQATPAALLPKLLGLRVALEQRPH